MSMAKYMNLHTDTTGQRATKMQKAMQATEAMTMIKAAVLLLASIVK